MMNSVNLEPHLRWLNVKSMTMRQIYCQISQKTNNFFCRLQSVPKESGYTFFVQEKNSEYEGMHAYSIRVCMHTCAWFMHAYSTPHAYICMHIVHYACIIMLYACIMHAYACISHSKTYGTIFILLGICMHICMHRHAYLSICMHKFLFMHAYRKSMHAYAKYMHAYACICMHKKKSEPFPNF